MKRRTTERVAAVVAILLGASPLRAAVVTGPDGKPVRGEAGRVGAGRIDSRAARRRTPPPARRGRRRFPGLPGGPLGAAPAAARADRRRPARRRATADAGDDAGAGGRRASPARRS